MTSAYASSILRKTLCHASRSKMPQNQTQRADFPKNGNLQKPKPLSFMLILLALLCGGTVAWAQDPVYPAYPTPAEFEDMPEWEGQNVGSYKITNDKTITSAINIAQNTSLYLYPAGGGEHKITKGTENTYLFFVRGNLYIIGNEENKLNIYGNCGNGTSSNQTPIPTQTDYQGAAVCAVYNAEVRIKYVDFYGFITHTGIPSSSTSSGIITMSGQYSADDPGGKCYMDHVTFKHSYGGPIKTNSWSQFGRIISFVQGVWDVRLDYVIIRDCIVSENSKGYYYDVPNGIDIDGMGSVIRSTGATGGSLTMRYCEAYNNTYRDLSGSENNSILDYKTMEQINAKPLSGQGGVINWRSGKKNPSGGTQVTIANCKFHHNSARQGGAIATCATINLVNTEIHDNEAVLGGGVYFYTYKGQDDPYDGRAFDAVFGSGVTIYDNKATEYGGGIYVGMEASNDVGFRAIYPPATWNNDTDTVNPWFRVIIEEGAQIYGNNAPKGGGMAIRDTAPYRHKNTKPTLLSSYSGSNTNPAYQQWSGEYKRLVSINGGEIFNNTTLATQGTEVGGGGIYIEKHPTRYTDFGTVDYNYNGEPGIYGSGTLTVNPGKGKIYNNSAINGTDDGYGGGIYIASKFTNPAIVSTLNVNIGKVGEVLEMHNNQAYTDGGGVYVWYDRTNDRQNEGTVTVEGGTIGKIDTTDPQNPVLCPNKALHGNGGGICVKGGTVSVKGGNIEYNTAGTSGGGVYVNVPNNESITTIQGNASISHNTANNGNGGGVCLDKGRINIYGSNISNNKATIGNGGGLYIQEGDILVWPNEVLVHPNAPVISQCEATKTTVLNNTAGGNGGGLNTHRGRFDVRFAQIKNNRAGYNYSSVGTTGGNGGGLFCDGTDHDNGYTVRLLHCDLEENKAFGNVLVGDGITGRGGGVYLKHGSIFAEHCDIIKNEADINGGGLDNHSGELRVYGTYIDENVAHEGRGGGLYTEEGNIVVGPCDTYGYKDSKASRIIKNKAKINGGGINNHKGDITIHGDRINENEAETGDGGGVYINEGNINMYGGQINNNKADKGKGGGVYGGGGKFNIMERKANPIVEILEVEDIKATQFKVHYHLVDRGLAPITVTGTGPDYTYSDPGNLTHGIAYSTKDPSTEPWTIADTTEITYTAGTTGHEYVLRQGCVRIPVTGLTSASGTTYYIIAWAKYTIDEGPNAGDYYDASPVIEIKAQDPTKQGKAPQGPRSVYPAVEENPFFMELTPLQQAMLTNTPEGDTTAAPASRAITDRDDPDPKAPENIPEINGNTAMFGGGICIDKKGAELIFAGSTKPDNDNTSNANKKKIIAQINYNYASGAGGGIYIGRESAENYAKMKMMGKCQVNYNHVPADKLGGGIYLDGRLYVGDKSTDNPVYNAVGNPNPVIHGLRVDRNFASSKTHAQWLEILPDTLSTSNPNYDNSWSNTSLMPDNSKLNNVFLTRYDYDYYVNIDEGHPGDNNISVITLLSDISGKNASDNDKPYSHIGFSVLKGFCPVIATASSFGGDYLTVQTTATNVNEHERWLYELMVLAGGSGNTAQTMTGAVFEDSESYVAVHTRQNMPPFLGKFIYLWGCWTHPIVKTDPETDNPMGKIYKYGTTQAESKFKGHYKIRNSFTDEGIPGSGYTATSTTPLVWEIYSPEGLAWFTSYVNGLNVFDEVEGGKMYDPSTGTYTTANDPNHFKWNKEQNPYAEAYIMNDLDMSAYLWVPIGSVQKFYISNLTATGDDASLFVDSEKGVPRPSTLPSTDPWYSNKEHYYRGKFDGQGHIIKGVQGLYLTGIRKFGLFGYLNGAEVKNTFIDDGLFVSDGDTITYSAGGIAGEIKSGSLSNSEARMSFNATHSGNNTKVGGLVGYLKGGNIHSCMAMPEFHGSAKYVGGLVGELGANTKLLNSFSNPKFPDVAYNDTICLSGQYVGDPPVWQVTDKENIYFGGLVGVNNGLVENCYSRLQGDEPKSNVTTSSNYNKSIFGWFAGTNNTDNFKYCYAAKGNVASEGVPAKPGIANGGEYQRAGEGTISHHGTYDTTKLVSDKYGFKHRDQAVEATNSYVDNDTLIGGLQRALNAWVKDVNKNGWDATNNINSYGYAVWTRTMASKINDDYPVLMFNDFNVVGTEDGIYMKYDDNVNDMWKKPNYESLIPADRTGKNFQGLTSYNNPKAAMYLYNTNYNPISITNNTAVRLHIHEDVGITQTDGAELHARVGVTFDNSNGSPLPALGGKAYDWHMFSSALQAAPMGLTYNSGGVAPHPTGKYQIKVNYNDLQGATGIIHENYTDREYMDPPVTTWNTDAGTIGYFPTNTPYGTWGSGHSPNSGENSDPVFNQGSFDFYCFHEESRHWINFKREGTTEFMDHWHEDIDGSGNHKNLWYKNESTFQVGKGYMMGVSAVSMLMADGILNNGVKSDPNEPTGKLYSAEELTNSDYGFNPSGYSEELRGTNLVGNPFQSYLNFSALANDNDNKNIIENGAYYLFDADARRYLCYPADASTNPINAPQFIHPHQGFFVKTANGGYLTFKNSMRSATAGNGSTFRGDNLNYPLVNLFCYDAEGHYDVTTVEMNRPKLGGGLKLKDMRNGNSLIYARLEDEDYQTLFAPTGTSTVPVRFEPSQDGVYTMRWGTLHGDFHYLHLVDNMSGADVDMLRSEEYRFEATTSDYLSRFKLVFEVTGLEEEDDNEDDNGSSIVNFAFRMGDEIIVNGEGYFELFDVQGRRLTAKHLAGAQSSVSLPNVAAGVYLLRLTSDKQVKTQKMVISY